MGERLITKDKRRARPYQSLSSRYNRKGRKWKWSTAAGVVDIFLSKRNVGEKESSSFLLTTLCSFYQKVVLGKDQQKFPLLGKLIPLWLHHTSFTLRCSDTPCSSSLFFFLVCQSSANVLANAHLQWDWATLALILQTIYFCSICKPFMYNLNIFYNFAVCKFAHWTICIFANFISFICLRLCKSFILHLQSACA